MGKANFDTRFVTSFVPQLLTMNEPVLLLTRRISALPLLALIQIGLQRETVYDLKTLCPPGLLTRQISTHFQPQERVGN
jgi:hypothetical protein